MTLLKGDDTVGQPRAAEMQPGAILTISDGWRFGIGFWLALILAIPIILFVLGLLFWMLLIMFGGLMGGLL